MENHIRQLLLASVKKKISENKSELSWAKLERSCGICGGYTAHHRRGERCKLRCFSNEGSNKLSLLHRESNANTVSSCHFLSTLDSSFKNEYLSPVFIGTHLITRFNLQFFCSSIYICLQETHMVDEGNSSLPSLIMVCCLHVLNHSTP